MPHPLLDSLARQAAALRDQGLYKRERVIASPQQAAITLAGGREVLNFCANNYLGLANDPRLVAAAKAALDRYGFGMSSVRFICGTQDVHRELEGRISAFLGTEDTILYGSCFDANGGLFEALLGPEDAVASDALNHASIIDGIRLCKAARLRYANNDMADLRARLAQARDQGARHVLVATDGVFSMDGTLADLGALCDLAAEFGALTMVDDSHGVGVLGAGGRGTHEHCGVLGRVDVITGTLGKALGGASGGYVSGRAEVVDWLRQRSRPYLFSNTLAPVIAATSLAVLDILADSGALRARLHAAAARFRAGMTGAGFRVPPGVHPIVPVMLGDAVLAQRMAARLLDEGIYVVGFAYPVVPQGAARIRVQLCAAHTDEHVDRAVDAFTRVGRELGVVS
ncbi:glycine C-acetyltransferase [Desulfocurvus vexinensis]|uniref:glycine C-acetyltransferase n=1 Tax=Desulfocurvus vexinensis TaxID=399548 RepID=UPI0006885D33|nr:glycine C-acetyltransferase [Desulfocurvus vexinensis]